MTSSWQCESGVLVYDLIWHVTQGFILAVSLRNLFAYGTHYQRDSSSLQAQQESRFIKIHGTVYVDVLNECCRFKTELCTSCVGNVFAVGLYSFSTSPDMISWLSDFLLYNVPSPFIEPCLLKRQTNAARNTGLPLQSLLHPPFHCLGSCSLAERTGSSPHGHVMDLNH